MSQKGLGLPPSGTVVGLRPKVTALYTSVAFVALALVFALTSPDNRFEAEDALGYAAAVESGQPRHLLSTNHLAYVPLSRLAYLGASRLGLAERALPVLVVLGSIAASGTVILFGLFLRTGLGVDLHKAVLGSLALATSYGFWRYAGEAEVYSFAGLAAAGLVLAAFKLGPSIGGKAALAVLSVAAILGHTLNLSVVLALPYILNRRGWSAKQIGALAAVGAALLVPLLVGAYQYAVANEIGQAGEVGIVGFYLGARLETELALGDVLPTVGIIGSLVVASNALFLYEPFRHLIVELVPGRAIADELHMGATAAPWIRWLAPLTLVIVIFCLVRLIVRLDFAEIIRTGSGQFLLFWMLGYCAIVVVGGSITQPEVWLLLLLPLWAAVILGLRRRQVGVRLLILAVASLGINSVVSGFAPLYTAEDRLESLTEWLAANTSESDLVLTADSAGLARYIAYHRPPYSAHIGGRGVEIGGVQEVMAIGEFIKRGADSGEILTYLETRRLLLGATASLLEGGELLITADLFDPPDWLVAARPEVAAALEELGREVGHLFQPADGSDFYSVLIREQQ